MDAATRAWLTMQLGTATDLVDLDARYTRLGTARAVAIEVLYERRAALVHGQPGTVNVPGVVSINVGENIKAIERQIAALEAGTPLAPDETDPDGDGTAGDTGLGTIRLIERPRR